MFGPDTTQKGLFEGTVKDLVKDVLEGGNSLVFTYGATNAGKTFTFLGLYFFHIMLYMVSFIIFSHLAKNVHMYINVYRYRNFIQPILFIVYFFVLFILLTSVLIIELALGKNKVI